MAGVIVKINSLHDCFSKAEKSIAAYVLKNAEKAPFQSVHELARITKVSVASVSRFSKKIGYANFKEFKIDLAKESSSSIEALSQGIKPEDLEEEIIKKVFGGNIRGLEDTLQILDFSNLGRAAKIISTSKRLVFFGIGSSGYIAQDTALRFSHLDVQTEAYIDSYQMLIQALRMKKNDVAFGLSHSGRSTITVEALKAAKKNKAATIGISNYLQSPLSDISDIFLCTAFRENRVRAAALSSRTAQLCLIDALYLLVARNKKTLLKTDKLDIFTEELLRLPVK